MKMEFNVFRYEVFDRKFQEYKYSIPFNVLDLWVQVDCEVRG